MELHADHRNEKATQTMGKGFLGAFQKSCFGLLVLMGMLSLLAALFKTVNLNMQLNLSTRQSVVWNVWLCSNNRKPFNKWSNPPTTRPSKITIALGLFHRLNCRITGNIVLPQLMWLTSKPGKLDWPPLPTSWTGQQNLYKSEMVTSSPNTHKMANFKCDQVCSEAQIFLKLHIRFLHLQTRFLVCLQFLFRQKNKSYYLDVDYQQIKHFFHFNWFKHMHRRRWIIVRWCLPSAAIKSKSHFVKRTSTMSYCERKFSLVKNLEMHERHALLFKN